MSKTFEQGVARLLTHISSGPASSTSYPDKLVKESAYLDALEFLLDRLCIDLEGAKEALKEEIATYVHREESRIDIAAAAELLTSKKDI